MEDHSYATGCESLAREEPGIFTGLKKKFESRLKANQNKSTTKHKISPDFFGGRAWLVDILVSIKKI